jgi:hypothetical protein
MVAMEVVPLPEHRQPRLLHELFAGLQRSRNLLLVDNRGTGTRA